MGDKELREFIIQERIGKCLQEVRESEGFIDGSENFEKVLMEKSPILIGDFRKFLDLLAISSGTEQEALYRFGLRDGIRIAMEITKIVDFL